MYVVFVAEMKAACYVVVLVVSSLNGDRIRCRVNIIEQGEIRMEKIN